MIIFLLASGKSNERYFCSIQGYFRSIEQAIASPLLFKYYLGYFKVIWLKNSGVA